MPQQQIEKVYLVLYRTIADTFAVEAFFEQRDANKRKMDLLASHCENVRMLPVVVK
jgi:hypothetical protein